MFEARENASHRNGTWKELQTEKGKSATFTCPACGTTGTLENHIINSSGETDVSVQCPGKRFDGTNCYFHDRVKLIGWDPNVKHDYRPFPRKLGED